MPHPTAGAQGMEENDGRAGRVTVFFDMKRRVLSHDSFAMRPGNV